MKKTFVNESKYLNNREYIEEYDTSMLTSKPQYEVVKNGFILPTSIEMKTRGGVVDSNRNYVQYSGNKCALPFINISKSYEFNEFNIEHQDEDVIFLGYYLLHWGHMLWDCIGKFWILNISQFSNYKVCFLPYTNETLKGNFLRLLELSGIDESRMVEIDQPSLFRTIIVPESSHDSGKWLHSEVYKTIFDTIVANSHYDRINVPSKVYFSRENFGKPEWGEEEISLNFEKNGFEVIYPEKITLDEQIAILQRADVVVSENSSICLNCVFAREGLKWIVINKYSAIHKNFSEFHYMSKINTVFIDAYSPYLDFYGDKIGTKPYLISFNRNMQNYFKDNNMSFEKTSFGERLRNICVYLLACIKEPFRTIFHSLLIKFAEWIKKYDFLYRFLKFTESLVHSLITKRRK